VQQRPNIPNDLMGYLALIGIGIGIGIDIAIDSDPDTDPAWVLVVLWRPVLAAVPAEAGRRQINE
jgi:hypothetical protein